MELQVDACSAEQGRALLAATDNPVGVLFDPEALVARWRGADPEEELLVQPAGEPSLDGLVLATCQLRAWHQRSFCHRPTHYHELVSI